MAKRVPAVFHMVFLICGMLLYFRVDRKKIKTKPDPHCLSPTLALQPMSTLSTYWICRREFEFDVVNLDLPQWIWICRGEFEFAEWIWICGGEFAAVDLNLPWWIWTYLGQSEFAVVSLPQWIWICLREFELASVNLNLPQQIWICRGKFEFAVVNLNFAVANLNLPW